jgi:hypothetical protein
MLSAGFATVTYLKSRLMPDAAADETEWDMTIAALGKSVAGKFDRFCNRTFARTEGKQDTFTARGSAWVLSCYPVEAIDSVILKDRDGSTSEIDAGEWSVDETCGLLETNSIAGARTQKVVVTYDGGYWLDPRDGSAMPAESNALPADVLEAWVLQCQHEAENRGVFHAVSMRSQSEGETPKTADLTLLAAVKETLNPFRRFAGE